MSLVSLVLVVVILGVMAAVAVKALDQDGVVDPRVELPAAPSGVDDATAGQPVTAVEAAAIAACQANAAALQQAATAATVTAGHPPDSLDDLVRQGFVHDFQPPAGYRYELQPTADGAASRIVVNGLPADEGCRNGPTQG